MKRSAFTLALLGAACSPTSPSSPHPEPATVEHPIPESELTLVRLTERAVERLDIETAEVHAYRGAAHRRVGGEVIVPPGRVLTVTAPVPGVVHLGEGLAPGATAREGDVLLRLVPLAPANRDTRARAEREVRAARAQLAAAEARLTRTEALAKRRAGSERATEEARAARDIAKADLDTALERSRAVRASPLLSDVSMRIRAPEGGLVRAVTVASGQAVAAGAALLEMVAVRQLWVRAPVASTDLRRLDDDASALVASLGTDEGVRPLEARPVMGPPTATPLASTVDRYYALDAPAPFELGERVLVWLPLETEQTATAIPFSAVFFDPSGTAWIYVCEGERAYRRARVDVLRRDGDEAVLARGPALGTCVVSVGAAELYGSEFEPGH